ncbi:uncharacterized protein V1510DRAFT_441125, partial [Dipodascopsis tothii]|uniref:uncharacterized protein n=1 Tax=Dipodascopsis tothii TaxID=44089 RepID=UPI0034CDC890
AHPPRQRPRGRRRRRGGAHLHLVWGTRAPRPGLGCRATQADGWALFKWHTHISDLISNLMLSGRTYIWSVPSHSGFPFIVFRSVLRNTPAPSSWSLRPPDESTERQSTHTPPPLPSSRRTTRPALCPGPAAHCAPAVRPPLASAPVHTTLHAQSPRASRIPMSQPKSMEFEVILLPPLPSLNTLSKTISISKMPSLLHSYLARHHAHPSKRKEYKDFTQAMDDLFQFNTYVFPGVKLNASEPYELLDIAMPRQAAFTPPSPCSLEWMLQNIAVMGRIYVCPVGQKEEKKWHGVARSAAMDKILNVKQSFGAAAGEPLYKITMRNFIEKSRKDRPASFPLMGDFITPGSNQPYRSKKNAPEKPKKRTKRGALAEAPDAANAPAFAPRGCSPASETGHGLAAAESPASAASAQFMDPILPAAAPFSPELAPRDALHRAPPREPEPDFFSDADADPFARASPRCDDELPHHCQQQLLHAIAPEAALAPPPAAPSVPHPHLHQHHQHLPHSQHLRHQHPLQHPHARPHSPHLAPHLAPAPTPPLHALPAHHAEPATLAQPGLQLHRALDKLPPSKLHRQEQVHDKLRLEHEPATLHADQLQRELQLLDAPRPPADEYLDTIAWKTKLSASEMVADLGLAAPDPAKGLGSVFDGIHMEKLKIQSPASANIACGGRFPPGCVKYPDMPAGDNVLRDVQLVYGSKAAPNMSVPAASSSRAKDAAMDFFYDQKIKLREHALADDEPDYFHKKSFFDAAALDQDTENDSANFDNLMKEYINVESCGPDLV